MPIFYEDTNFRYEASGFFNAHIITVLSSGERKKVSKLDIAKLKEIFAKFNIIGDLSDVESRQMTIRTYYYLLGSTIGRDEANAFAQLSPIEFVLMLYSEIQEERVLTSKYGIKLLEDDNFTVLYDNGAGAYYVMTTDMPEPKRSNDRSAILITEILEEIHTSEASKTHIALASTYALGRFAAYVLNLNDFTSDMFIDAVPSKFAANAIYSARIVTGDVVNPGF